MAVSIRDVGIGACIGAAIGLGCSELIIKTLNTAAQNVLAVSMRDVGVSFLKAGGGVSLFAMSYPLMMKTFESVGQIIGISADELRDVQKKMSERTGFFKVVVIAPIIEEVICRGLIQENLESYLGNSTWSQIGTILLVSSCFGAAHLLNLKGVVSIVDPAMVGEPAHRQWSSLSGRYVKFQTLAAAAGGVVLGAIKSFSGLGICGSIGAHMFNNALACFRP